MKIELHNAVIGEVPPSGNGGVRGSAISRTCSSMTFAETSEVANTNAQTRIRPGTVGQWEKQCPRCSEWVGLGRNGSLHTLIVHQDGQRCSRTAERKARARKEEALAFPLASATSGSPTFSPPLFSAYPDVTMSEPSPFDLSSPDQPASPYSNVPTTFASSLLTFSRVPSPNLPEQASCTSPAISNTVVSNTLQIAPPQISTVSKVPCLGIRLKWERGHPARTYPFQYHDTGNPTWFATAAGPHESDYIYLRSTSCNLFRDPFLEACSECVKVPSSTKFQSLVRRASKDPAPSTPDVFLSWEQLLCKVRSRTHENRQLRKKVCSTSLLQTQC